MEEEEEEEEEEEDEEEEDEEEEEEEEERMKMKKTKVKQYYTHVSYNNSKTYMYLNVSWCLLEGDRRHTFSVCITVYIS